MSIDRQDPGAAKRPSRQELVEALCEGRLRWHALPAEIPPAEQAEIRREALVRLRGGKLEQVARYTFDEEVAARRNCENFIGAAQIPLGVVGPVAVRGEACNEDVMVPLATTEGALIASINRGCSAIRRAGGAVVYVEDIGMTRAPVFRTSGIQQTRAFLDWVRDNHDRLREHCEGTSRFLRLREIKPHTLGTTVWLRFRFTTGDAMGMNMATIACDRVVRDLIVPETGVPCVALSGNFCVDKKPAAINWQEGRGKRLHAEVVLEREVLAKALKTDVRSLVEAQYRKNLMGSIAAGARAYNAQVANVLAAYFIATGQDLAHVVEGCLGVTCIEELPDGAAYASITLPNVPLGAVGGGTTLATQRECLELLGVRPDAALPGFAVTRLGEILGGVVLAGELSLMAAFTSDDLASAHEKLARGTDAKTAGDGKRPVMVAAAPRSDEPGTLRPARVSAPGKLILAGEHAAVYGHPAMVAAIDLRLGVDVSVEGAPKDGVAFDLPQLGWQGEASWKEIRSFAEQCRQQWRSCYEDVTGSGPSFHMPEDRPDRLVQVALGETCRHLGWEPKGGLRLKVDSRLPVGSGFGSSAAVGVGVASALLAATGHGLDRELLGKISLEVERRQHGTPSGVDNAAVIDGGVLWAQRDDKGEIHYERIPADSPFLNRFRVFHSGQPAEPTGDIVAAVRRRIQKAREGLWTILGLIGEATAELRRLLLNQDAGDHARMLTLLRECEGWLEDLGVVPKPIRKVIRMIEDRGGAAKISGAGALTGDAGGSVIIYHQDPDAIARWDFLNEWSQLPVRLGAEGVRQEVSA